MPRKKYTSAQIQEAVALGRVVGSDTAGERLGIDPRTIVKWMEKAGDPPELAGDAGQWRSAWDLANATLQSMVSGGKLSAVQLATVMGIAQRNMRELEKAEQRKAEATDDWAERFDRWCDERYPTTHLAELAKDVPTSVLVYWFRAGVVDDTPADDRSRPTRSDEEHWFGWCCAVVEAIDDLETFAAEYGRWQVEQETYESTVRRRTEVIVWADNRSHDAPPTIRYPEAMETARIVSADLEPTPPSWAPAVLHMLETEDAE